MAATPGHWQAARDCGAYGDAGAYAVYDSDGRKLALVFANDIGSVATERARDNAQLMAAAPALADALRRLLHQVDYMGAPADHPDMIAAREALTAAGVAEI